MGFLRIILYPFAVVFGFISRLRNRLFDLGILPSESFDIPVISVGNLCMGGTGKTPHVEYLICLLKDKYHLATLSRGYGRKTRGFRLAATGSSVKDIGDEPVLLKGKFPEVMVAVDESRRRGVRKLMELDPVPDVILLDDAYQHRYIQPGLNILLTDYFNLYTKDYLIPAGRLREPKSGAKRADIIVVTKTDPVWSPITERYLREELCPEPDQTVCYSYLKYGDPVALSGEKTDLCLQKKGSVLMVSGIANPYPLEVYLKSHFNEFERLTFRDHHQFTAGDVKKIRSVFVSMMGREKIILTTEKDAIRMREANIADLLMDLPVYYLPVRIEFHSASSQTFDSRVLNYVEESK
ncbi:MAG TPA: tetraacyldisaccharide 4'-kinase [Bacteroidales bacterium]|nr:tetraacyldisaccharide 4'-kinase [Bacteroidales bacterium]HNS45713.1 tetraacyldisaccharide 4'-kinase [Bacteroidales bacterium]